MLAKSNVWEKCDRCGLWWDGLRLFYVNVVSGIKGFCPLCRGISDWARAADNRGIV